RSASRVGAGMIVMPLRPGGPREVPALGGWRFDEGEACIVGPVRDAESCMRLIRGGAGSGGRGRVARACDETGAPPGGGGRCGWPAVEAGNLPLSDVRRGREGRATAAEARRPDNDARVARIVRRATR